MIHSMTGFGRGTGKSPGYELFVNITTVNSRFLDLNFHLPKPLYYYQQEIRDLVRELVPRGKVNVYVNLSRTEKGGIGTMTMEQADRLLKQIEKTAGKLGIENDVRMSHLPAFESFLTSEEDMKENEELWTLTQKTLRKALTNLQQMRKEEGKALLADFRSRITIISKQLKLIETYFQRNRLKVRENLQEKISTLLETTELKPERLDMEVAFLLDKLDVNEEITRLRSHDKLFLDTLKAKDEPVGKKLNFLLQEMNREANTIASKSNSTEIAHCTVIIKEEIENIREQIQNVQ